MITVSVSEAKRDLVALVEKVIAGEEVLITRWGQPVARMVRVRD
jgi:prevent-host-death family protein